MIYFAVWRLGACLVPVDVDESPAYKYHVIKSSRSMVVFCSPRLLGETREIIGRLSNRPELVQVGGVAIPGTRFWERAIRNKSKAPLECASGLDDDFLIIYTSGTTGLPKGVVLTFRNLLAGAEGIVDWFGFNAGDRLMNVLPLHHVNGLVVTLLTPFFANCAVIMNSGFSSGTFWRQIAEERVSFASVVPTFLEFLLSADGDTSKYDLTSFRGVICGAGPLSAETALNFEKRFGFPVIHGYGLSEATCYSCFLPLELTGAERRRWLVESGFPSVGVPIKHNEMAVIGPDGRELEEMERGEIVIRGRTVMKEYFNSFEANMESFRYGWFLSGDEGFYKLEEKGLKFFFITGRIKELIVRGGMNVSPLEVDNVLRLYPKVRFAMALSFDNRFYGEEVAAYVVPKEGTSVSEEEILDHCARYLPFYKQPKVVVFGREIPVDSGGKPKRLELKQKLQKKLVRYREVKFLKKM